MNLISNLVVGGVIGVVVLLGATVGRATVEDTLRNRGAFNLRAESDVAPETREEQ